MSRSDREESPVGQLFVVILWSEDRDEILLVRDQQFSRETPFVHYVFLLENRGEGGGKLCASPLWQEKDPCTA